MSRCPRREQLRHLLADTLPAADARALEAHVQACAGCQGALEQLTAACTSPSPASRRGGADARFLHRLEEAPPPPARPAAPTIVTPGEPTPAAATISPARVAGPQSARELLTLLRKRLLFITVMCFFGLAAYARTYLQASSGAVPVVLTLMALLLTAYLAGALWSDCPLTQRQLRGIELAVFLTAAVFITVGQWHFLQAGWLAQLAESDWPGVRLLARSMSLSWVAVILGYGILVPNTWRRCALVVCVLAAWPMLLYAWGGFREAGVEGRLLVLFVLETGLCTGLAAATAVYGSYRIETLRQQASGRKVGPYRLRDRLGAGGMGEVWLAEHGLLRRPCAVKFIRPECVGDPQYLRRFEREVRATATLSHPNTVEVYDYGRADDGTFYYAMEYLPGLSLDGLVAQYGPPPAPRVVHLLHQVCGALQEAHAAGMVHRDVKPSNVLVCERGGRRDVAKLLDFGLVRAPSLTGGQTFTREGTIAGTPGYLSPEQARSKADLDARSDIYSLGAVAYFLLTGHQPFERASAAETIAAHLHDQVQPPDRHRPDVPADLQAVVLRCLEKDPARRFQGADELEQALAGCACAGQWTRERADDWWRKHAARNGRGSNEEKR